ncbi:hypothetical protein Ddc_05334 [Ditylenchus destructor]|nr:hypothetical protein Ddc_05334 [Ditylenchus destructor]
MTEVSEIPSGSGSKETEAVQQGETNADSQPRPRTRRGGLKKNRKKFVLPYTEGQWNPVSIGKAQSEPAYSQYILKNHPWWRKEEPEIVEKKPRERSNNQKNNKKSSKNGTPEAQHVERLQIPSTAKKAHIPSLSSLNIGNKVSQYNGIWPEPSYQFPESHDKPTIPKQIRQQIKGYIGHGSTLQKTQNGPHKDLNSSTNFELNGINNMGPLQNMLPKSLGTVVTDQGEKHRDTRVRSVIHKYVGEGRTDETNLSYWPYRAKPLQLKQKNPEPSAGPSWMTAQDASSTRTSNVPTISHGYAGFDNSSAAQYATNAPTNTQMFAAPAWASAQVVASSAVTSTMPAISHAYPNFGNASAAVNVQTPGYDPNGVPAAYSGPQYPQLSAENYAQYYETYQQQMWMAQYGENFNRGGT